MKLDRFFALAIVAGAFGAFGCSSSSGGTTVITKTDSGTDTGHVTTTDSGSQATDSGSGTTDTGSGGGSCSTDATCDGSANFQACAQCYGQKTACQAGAQAYVGVVDQFWHCAACTSSGACYSQCSNGADPICSNSTATPAAACNTCVGALGSSDACMTAANSSCSGNPDCVAFATAIQGCPTN